MSASDVSLLSMLLRRARLMLLVAGCVVLSGLGWPGVHPATAETAECPAARLDTDRVGALITQLQQAPDAKAARRFNADLWEIWTTAPDARAQDLLNSGMARLRIGDLQTATQAFDALVAYCPNYAEGYNQRAFAAYLRQDYAPALRDLDIALSHSPRHIGALSGKALTLIGLGRDAEALETLRAALALNPWLSEAALLPTLKKRLGAKEL